MGIRLKQSTKNRGLSPIIEKNVVCPLLLSITLNLMILLRIFFAFKRVFGLVIDFGTSQSPKSTRPLTTYWCPSRPGHQALRNNFASSLLLRTCLPMTGRRVRRPTLFSLWRKARRENSAASRLLGSISLRFALHGRQRGIGERCVLGHRTMPDDDGCFIRCQGRLVRSHSLNRPRTVAHTDQLTERRPCAFGDVHDGELPPRLHR